MSSKEECEQFAAEANRRFEEFTSWLTTNWPKKDRPLMESDFGASRAELAQLLGEKLGEPTEPGDGTTSVKPAYENPQYINSAPMPWP